MKATGGLGAFLSLAGAMDSLSQLEDGELPTNSQVTQLASGLIGVSAFLASTAVSMTLLPLIAGIDGVRVGTLTPSCFGFIGIAENISKREPWSLRQLLAKKRSATV